MTRLALIHALAHSVDPINAALVQAWPEVLRMNLLDDSLSADLARSGGVWTTPCMRVSLRWPTML